MFRNYFKIALNTYKRNKAFTAINIIGLSIGIAAAFLIYSYIKFELSYDTFHANYDKIYRLSTDVKTTDELIKDDKTSAVIAPLLINELPEITTFVRLSPHSILTRVEDKKFQEESTFYADSTLFSVFSIKLVKGDSKTALTGPLKVLLTESNAKKYFGNKDPLGQLILLGGFGHHGIVTGVVSDLPENSHIKAKMFLSMATKEYFAPGVMQDPLTTQWYTFLILKDGVNLSNLESKISNVVSKKYGKWFEHNHVNQSFVIEPLKDIYLNSNRKSLDSFKFAHGSSFNTNTFGYIAIFIIIIACINFINLSTSKANERAREVGIRKVTGATKFELITQFLIESLLTSTIAGFVAICIVIIAIPLFNNLSGKIIIENILEFKGEFIKILLGSLIIGLASGIYPAFILSEFKPINVLKGKFVSRPKGIILRKGLVVFQFTVSILLILITIVVYKQLNFMRSEELGFKKDQMLVIDYHFETNGRLLAENIGKIPTVNSCAISASIPGYNFYKLKLKTDIADKTGEFQTFLLNTYLIDYNFLKHYNIPLISGRNFSSTYSTDSLEAIILNETAVKRLGFKTPQDAIGKRFKQYDTKGQIIGVTKDFHDLSLKEEIEALCYRFIYRHPGNFITANVSSNNIPLTINKIRKEWDKYIGHRPFEYFFLDESFNKQYKSEEQFGKLFFTFSFLSIIISCLGLIGLVSYHTIQRTKEIGIRKILGATLFKIINVLSKDYLKLVGLSLILSSSLSIYLIKKWLENFAYKTSISWSVFLYAGIAAFVLALISISFFTIKAALANPTKSLRTE